MPSCPPRTRAAFTLIELLVVIAIIALLAAILFPVFATVRGKARQTVCVSNLKQVGTAIQMYAQDYDGLMPYAKDASDAFVPQIWAQHPACQTEIQAMPFLHPSQSPVGRQPGALDPYVKSDDVWRCPSDTGFDYLDNNDSCDGPCPLDARPTMFRKYGASYLYRTEVAFRHLNLDTVSALDSQGNEVGGAGIGVLFDGNGSWHGGLLTFTRSGLRYNVLFGDGHAKHATYEQYLRAWAVHISGGESPCQ